MRPELAGRRLVTGLRSRLEWAVHETRIQALERIHPLRYLFFEVSRRCNLACAYCGSSCDAGPRGDELPISEWLRVAREIARDFDPSSVMIAVTGGEPLLKQGIFELFAGLHRLGFPFGMVSNGQLLDEETARKIVAAGMSSVSLSLDGPPSVNDELRGRGVSGKVVAAIGNLQRAGFRGQLEVISTITAPAVEKLDEMRRFLAGLQVPNWRVVPVMPIGRAAQRPDLIPTNAQLRGLLEYVREARLDRRLPAPVFGEEGFLGEAFEGQVRPRLWVCGAGVTVGGIRADGRIGACPELGDAFLQGDVRTERFRDVWESRYQLFRDRSWTRKGNCASCEQFRRCRGGSLHLYESPDALATRCLFKDVVCGQV